MTGWRQTTLGEIIVLQRGHDLTESQRTHGPVPVIGSAGQNGWASSCSLRSSLYLRMPSTHSGKTLASARVATGQLGSPVSAPLAMMVSTWTLASGVRRA